MIQQVHIRNIRKITIMTSVTLTTASDTCREDSIAINNSGRTRKHYAQWPIREGKAVKTLTIIALVFAPLAHTASLLSIGDNVCLNPRALACTSKSPLT
jgi:hypothetical protein